MDTAKLEKSVEKLEKMVEDHEKQLEFQKDYFEKKIVGAHGYAETISRDDKRNAIHYTNTKMKDVYAVLKAMGEKIKKLEEAAFSEPRPR